MEIFSLSAKCIEMLGLECSTVCSRDVDDDAEISKCGYGEEWKRSAGLIMLLIRQFSVE